MSADEIRTEANRVTLAVLRLEHLRRTKCSPECDHVIALRRVADEVTDHLTAAGLLPTGVINDPAVRPPADGEATS